MATLERAIAIAAKAHEGQLEKGGLPYVLHPLRLMMRMTSLEAKMAAVLHDVVEDTEWTLDMLAREGFPAEVLDAVDSLTHRSEEPYEDYVARAARHPIARQVKLADLEDNMNIMRLAELRDKDLERIRKYHRAWKQLREV